MLCLRMKGLIISRGPVILVIMRNTRKEKKLSWFEKRAQKNMPALLKTPKRFPKSLPHSRQKHAVAYPNPQMYTFIAVYSKHVKLLSKKRMKSQILYMHMQHHFVKDRTMIVNLFLSHSYILILPQKSIFSI